MHDFDRTARLGLSASEKRPRNNPKPEVSVDHIELDFETSNQPPWWWSSWELKLFWPTLALFAVMMIWACIAGS